MKQSEIETENLLEKIEDLQNRLAEAEQLIEAIKAGEVDAFAINSESKSEVFTLQSGDYVYRMLIEKFGEGAVNLTEDGLIVYSNTAFSDLLGLPHEKIVGRYFHEFIDTDSKENFKDCFSEGLKGTCKAEINLASGERIIPVYVSLTSLKPTLDTVGMIITDFTEKKKHEAAILQYQQDLEAKNLDLQQSNTELASFTYVASHDLQEPLRKINVFSRLIMERELSNLSEEGRDFFERISNAAGRMQDLILSLINYSRMNPSEIQKTPIDLNELIEDIKVNISDLLKENNATIETSPLPTLNVIPVQVNQLFTNIILNAVKYRKLDRATVIKIKADKVTLDFKRSADLNNFWKIDIADNGIGFDQQYSERIFELFQRLHRRTEYEGTGIGLAICKKIVRNHGGFISARGQVGIGSTFSILLPEENQS